MTYLSCIEESIGHDWLCARIFSERHQLVLGGAPSPLLEQQIRRIPGVQQLRVEGCRVDIDYDLRQLNRRELEKAVSQLQPA